MSKIDSDLPKKLLYLDVGNSSIKGAYKKGANWEPIHAKRKYTASELIQWIDSHPETFSQILLASVREDVQQAIRQQISHVQLKELSVKDIPGDLLDYQTPETLGIDRFLSCYGATGQTKNSVVVIDAGTALTIDFMDQDDVYHGGLIAPGLISFGQILPTTAPALPNVEMDIPQTWPGKSTVDSLKWGQAGFYRMAIEKSLEKYEADFGQFDLFITGGNGQLIESLLERDSKLRPFLVFDGMQRLEQRTRNSEQGTANKEQGTKEQRTRNKEQGTRNKGTRNKGTRNKEQGTRNKEQRNKEQGTKEQGTKEQGTRNKEQRNKGTANSE